MFVPKILSVGNLKKFMEIIKNLLTKAQKYAIIYTERKKG